MEYLKNMNVSTKIFSGFGVIIFFVLVISSVGYFELISTGENFTRYRALALQTNESGRVQANLLEARLQAKNFIIDPTEKNIRAVIERINVTLELAEKLKEVSDDEIKVKTADDAEKALQQYLFAFEKITELQAHRNEIVHGSLDEIGPQMEKDLSAIMESAFDDGDTEATYHASKVLRNLLLARLYVNKYLIENNEEAYKRVVLEVELMRDNVEALLSSLQNPTRRNLTDKIKSNVDQYYNAFLDVHTTILDRNDLIKNTLDQIGPKVAMDIENLKLSVKKEQDVLGPEADSAIKVATTVTLAVSIICILFSIISALLIGRSVSNPIKTMTFAMGALAKGDKSVTIPSSGIENEIGHMADAVVVFKENMIKADRLAEEQEIEEKEKEKEQLRLKELIAKFEVTMAGVLDNLNSADQIMSKAAGDVKNTSESTKVESQTVASSAVQASSNVQTVATAAEELSASITEISRQVTQSNNVSNDAVSEANKTSEQIKILEENVSQISAVVSLINDIAEQTNLLALNATIEAARAGDAGKGFAVVASEVKNLASQTAKATEEISTQIAEVQSSTDGAVGAINSISGIIGTINEVSASISAAVEEQGAATSEIARNVEEAARGTESVSSSIQDVLHAAEQSSTAAQTITEASNGLSQQTNELRNEVSAFLNEVQNGGDNSNNAEPNDENQNFQSENNELIA